MKLLGGTALALLALGNAVAAGGIERSPQSTAILFEDGNYFEVTYSNVNPTVSGTATATYGGVDTGDMAESYNQLNFGAKFELSEKLNLALIQDSPVGADVFYPTTSGVPFPFAGAGSDHVFSGGNADLNSNSLAAYLRYELPNNFSLVGGIRRVSVGGELGIPFFNNYTLDVEDSTEIGYSAGIAWEKPEIAARVALTFHSATDHTFASTENTNAAPIPDPFPDFDDFTGSFDVTIPKSVNLDFQTGVAADTLVFGSIRWVDWSSFDITPPGYNAFSGGGSLVDYDDDVITYNLGVGRRLNENWSIAATVGHEKSGGGYVGNLGPTDGYTSLGLGATYTNGNIKITGGVRHVWIGDADTFGPPITGITAGEELANFRDNSAWAWGLRVGYYF
ncbi:outer membrane protein transport protein [Actibacterium pelagium]|uniref:Membrane protein n=1 Tax=Actibacterium pelagium TaxID=2029103 RepID=A0A917AC77_9RHOB|nr:outer membrane protein transport protein [Actibacterium pelagium]GGE42056.1 membrane protein [Actibacterium pelagium]